MYLVAIGWLYVALMMALAEALSPDGSVLGALITFVFYGALPLALVMYILGTPARRRARRAADVAATISGQAPDRGGHAAGGAIAAEREEV